jgi:hypothetical protein
VQFNLAVLVSCAVGRITDTANVLAGFFTSFGCHHEKTLSAGPKQGHCRIRLAFFLKERGGAIKMTIFAGCLQKSGTFFDQCSSTIELCQLLLLILVHL